MSRWRDVPMPPAVAALPRDKRGFPVPWISDWSETGDDNNGSIRTVSAPHLGVVSCPAVDCEHVNGEGIPNLGALCPRQQVDGMLERLCDVCGAFIPPGPIYFIGSGSLLDARQGAFRECGLHYECALYSAQVCPGLTTAGAKVSVFECLAYQPLPMFLYGKRGPVGQIETEEAMFESFQNAVLWMADNAHNGTGVLTAVHATPIDPKITALPDWVAQQLSLQGVRP